MQSDSVSLPINEDTESTGSPMKACNIFSILVFIFNPMRAYFDNAYNESKQSFQLTKHTLMHSLKDEVLRKFIKLTHEERSKLLIQ